MAPTARPGASRTLVLNRARGEATDPQRAAEVRFMRFFQSTPMAIATVDKAGRISRTNTLFARMFQSSLKEGDKNSILSVVSERDREALESAIRRAAERQSEIAPVDTALAGGNDRWARFYVSAVEDDEPDAETAIVYALETTGQRTLENQVNQRARMESVGQLAGGIAHDFNNVLSAIMMATDFLLNAHKPTDPSFQDIMQIKQNANRAASLVRQLLAFSRRQTLRPQVLDLGEVLSELTMLLRRLIGEKVALEVKHGRDLWPVKADISQFEQVIVNLAVNARDAMPDGGKLTVRTANVTAAECAQFAATRACRPPTTCWSRSPTPAPASRRRSSTRFSSRSSRPRRSARAPASAFRRCTASSSRPAASSIRTPTIGKGTLFRIFLPRHVPSAEEVADAMPQTEAPGIAGALARQPSAAPRRADMTGQGTILLVEDEEGLRALNARGLKSRGYNVIEAGNGVEAMEVLEKHGGKVDLVVSDVVMPEMDGPTLLKELRKSNPDLKMIFVSGYAEEAFEKSLPAGEKFAFLPKPFTLKQLIEQVKQTMKG